VTFIKEEAEVNNDCFFFALEVFSAPFVPTFELASLVRVSALITVSQPHSV
jgi:hypothetical protein